MATPDMKRQENKLFLGLSASSEGHSDPGPFHEI